MDLQYSIQFFSDWHCGSGLAAGAYVDALVIKDQDGLPFIPGKTVKGLVREAAQDILRFKYGSKEEKTAEAKMLYAAFEEFFGFFDGNSDRMVRGTAFFTNAELPENERQAILAEKLQAQMYRTVASTAISPDGVAIPQSLRRMEVVVPCTLKGEILGIPDNEDFKKLITDSLHYIKRLGQNRNRGLGRCSFSLNQ